MDEKKTNPQIEVVDIDSLIPDDRNFNAGTDEGKQLIARSFREHGAGRSVFLDRNNRLVAGNKATDGAREAGIRKVIIVDTAPDELVAVRRKDVDLDTAEGRKMALLDNLTQQVSLAWDADEIQTVSSEIEGFDPSDYGFDPSQLEVAGIGEGTAPATQTAEKEAKEDDFDPDAEHYEPKVKRGEVWLLGNHRLMCGDSTSAEDVARLMNGEKADLCFTDPPYGMNLDTDYSSMQNHLDFAKEKGFTGGKKYDAGHVDDFHPEMVQAALNIGAKETFLWGADYYADLLPNRNDGSWIVWDKRSNNTDDIEADESSDRMYGSCFELCWSKTKHKRDIARIKWAGVFGTEQEFDHKRHHPTQKPVKLSGWFVSRYSKEGDIVVDLFGGSGSTMIACEQLDRKCRMMELDPHYCDVIIARWEKLTGEKARKAE